MIRLVCVRCGHEINTHAGTFDTASRRYRCADGELADRGAMLLDSHALDDVPPAMRALERARLAQMKHERRVDVQLGLSCDEAFEAEE